jgi:Phosphotransferase enzyme family
VTRIPSAEIELVFGDGARASVVRRLRRTPPAATRGLWLVESGSDAAVLKVVHEGSGGSRWPATADPESPYYWRREPLAYTSGLLERLGPALRAPGLRSSVERPDGSVALWLELVPEVGRWTPELLAATAWRLGRAQGELALDLPEAPWLSRGWLRAYLALHAVDDPEAEAVLAGLDELPQTLCHHDLHPANVLGGDAAVVVDWAYCGLAALGLDAGVLVADGVADSAIPPPEVDEAADAVWAGYSAGLRDAGWVGDEDGIRWAFLRGTALRLSWLQSSVSRVSEESTRRAWTAAIGLLDRWRGEARSLER